MTLRAWINADASGNCSVNTETSGYVVDSDPAKSMTQYHRTGCKLFRMSFGLEGRTVTNTYKQDTAIRHAKRTPGARERVWN